MTGRNGSAEIVELGSVPGFVVFDLPGAPLSAGGTRLAPDVSVAEVAVLARSMTYKFAALGERVGGAKAGVRGDPADRAGKAALMARFCAEVRPANRPEDSCGAGGASRPARRSRPRIEGGQHADLGCDHVTPQRTAAADLGIGSCHAGVADLALARELLGFPEDRGWALLISLGYPADRPLTPVRKPDRRPFGEVVHRGRW